MGMTEHTRKMQAMLDYLSITFAKAGVELDFDYDPEKEAVIIYSPERDERFYVNVRMDSVAAALFDVFKQANQFLHA